MIMKMSGSNIFILLLIGLTLLSTVTGQCPFAGSIGAADEAGKEDNEENPYSGSVETNTYTLYTKKFHNGKDNEDLKGVARVKRNLRIPEEAVRTAVEDGWRMAEMSKKKLASFRENEGPQYMSTNDSAYGHFVNFRVNEPAIDLHSLSTAMIRATKKLQQDYAHRFGMTPFTFTQFLHNNGYTASELVGTCRPNPVCRKHQLHYRTMDGSCNNLISSAWGMSKTALVRIAPPKYLDAIYEPPKSVTGHPLPSPALVSLVLFPDINRPDPIWTRATMVWGQFMGHDMSLTPSTQSKDGPIQCCTTNNAGPLPPSKLHPACLPIEVPEFHPFYSKFGVRCLNFVRTMTVPSHGCKLGAGQQMNAVTSYLDLSPVYGSNDKEGSALRTHRRGLLKASLSTATGGEVLPKADNANQVCDIKDKSEPCYKAGDVRVNLHLDLALLQIMMMRFHNNIARKFHELNPHWKDEKIYQEARKFCIAAYQHICYNEWLPIILDFLEGRTLNIFYDTAGKDFMVRHGLLRYDVNPHGYVDDYDHKIPASVINEHTASAFRFLHSISPGNLELLTSRREIYDELPLSDNFNRPAPLEEDHTFHGLLRGLTTQPMQLSDQYFTHELTRLLFKQDKPFGLDLLSLDIQRHRDHGLGSYNDYRYICGLRKATKWEDFMDFIHPEKIERLKRLYRDVNDVDLEAGCALEDHVSGSLLGPTCLCVIGEQFYRTRVGDRFFYMNGRYGSYDRVKLAEVTKYTWSKLVCETSEGIHEMQPEGFRQLSERNSLTNCGELLYIDLSPWKE